MSKIIDNEYYLAMKHDELIIISFKARIYDFITNLDESQQLMDFLKEAEYDKEVKAIVLLNENDCLGEKAYDEFMSSIIKDIPQESKKDVPTFIERNVRFREINILNKFIKYLASYQKLIIAGIKGGIVTPFIGVILAADLRFGAESSYLSMAHKKYGLHPSGGLPFFLTHYLQHAKALEVQFSDRIDALEAYKLELINKILPDDNFNDICLSEVKKYTTINSCTLRFTKRLTNYSMRLLEGYFDYEASLLNL